ncbi:MAG: HlyD family efflux transporter periplasmic adaptor subunit [Syntrophales bacterium]|jgi:HlyD family secretion protein|nr:HlyD family efflux transporter periplasmic adaptor subunit [Syntrophales bacterium]
MKAATRRTLLLTIIILAVILATIYGFLPKPIAVDLVAAERGPLRVAIEEEGRTRLKERFLVSAPVAGYITRNRLNVGDALRKGQVLVSIEPPRSQPLDRRTREEGNALVLVAEAGFKAAREKEQAAQADVEYSEKRVERIRNLYLKRYVAKDQLDQTEAEAKKAKAVQLAAAAAAEASRFELERAKAALKNVSSRVNHEKPETLKIASPLDGVVFRVLRKSEGPVSAGEPLLEIGDVRALEVRVEVLSSDAVRIKKGTKAVFKRWGGEETLEGVVRTVEPAGFTKISSLGVEEQRVLVLADIVSPPETWRAVGDGYRLDASFIVWEKEGVLQVPVGALFRSGQNWAVFVDENGRARQRVLKIGQRNGLAAEVVTGLKEGERVITHPDDAVKDGVRITGGAGL